MSNRLGELSLDEAAAAAAGNWKEFNSFGWGRQRELADADQWAIIYTSNRDSDCLDKSNESVINAALEPFTDGDDPDVVMESHSHWAVGYVDGFSVRVYRDGEITPAFAAYHALAVRHANYPILDEDDYSNREWDEFCESWDSWGCGEFVKELGGVFTLGDRSMKLLENADREALREFWMDHANFPYEPDGSGVRIPTDRTADWLDSADVVGLLLSLRAAQHATT